MRKSSSEQQIGDSDLLRHEFLGAFMRRSRHIVNRLSFGFLLAAIFVTAAYSQESAAPGSAQPSRESSTVADSPSAAEPAQPAEDLATSAGPSQPSEATATIASPQSATQATSSGTAAASSPDETSDKTWHYYGTVYLWVPSMHGSIGVAGYDTNIHVTTGDIFSNFRGGFLGVFTPTYNRFSAPVDVLWMRLRSSKPIPFEGLPGYSLRATLNESIITPKVNYLAVNTPKLKIYGTAGARIWHVGTTLSLVPVVSGIFPYKGVTWIDYVMGARFNVPLGTKASVDILGDGGEGGATLDYQIGGIVNLKLKPKLTAQVGWRYLTEHYGNNGNILNTTTQGVVFGATYPFK
jgi:hypothetical protein